MKTMKPEDFFTTWWKTHQKNRPQPMRKPFGHYMNDKYNFAKAYAKHIIESVGDEIDAEQFCDEYTDAPTNSHGFMAGWNKLKQLLKQTL